MAKVETMSVSEKLDILHESYALEDAGNIEEADRLVKTVPLPYYLAKVIKDKLGLDYLKSMGWNLSEAEARFGAEWLNK